MASDSCPRLANIGARLRRSKVWCDCGKAERLSKPHHDQKCQTKAATGEELWGYRRSSWNGATATVAVKVGVPRD